MATILVLGQTGQLATSIRVHAGGRAAGVQPHTLVCAGRAACDMQDSAALRAFLGDVRPDVIINAAAYSDVDGAETHMWRALGLNAVAVREVARFSEARAIPLIHISTDYVYDGEKGAPYVEADPMRPISAYGYSKALGDAAVIEHGGTVLRTAWLFSAHARNFVRTMIAAAARQDVVRVVADQVGNPTCADDLAAACLSLAERLLAGERHAGLYLAAGAPWASWADLAEAVFDAMARRGLKRPGLERIDRAQYPTPARRPRDTRLDTTRFSEALSAPPFDWRDGVERVVAAAAAD